MTGTVIRRIGHATVVQLAGDVDIAVADALHRRIARETTGSPAVVLDLSAVTFLDSAGVRLVDDLARDCGARQAQLRVVAPPDTSPHMALTLCAFPDALLAGSVDDAIAQTGEL